MFACTTCGARCGIMAHFCARCAGFNSFVPVVDGPASHALSDTVVVSADQLYKREATFLKLADEWGRVLGRLPRSPFMLAIYGPPGAMKTTTLSRLLAHLCEIGAGPAVLDQLEEGLGPSYVDVLRRLEVMRSDFFVTCCNDLGTLVEIVREKEAHVVAIDSLSMTGLGADDLARFVRETSTSLVYTLQATKDGASRGSLALIHVADIVLRLAPGGVFALEKSRYSERKEGTVPWARTASSA